ncbi:MAG: flagellar basal body rod protein FlgB [Chromatiales bacterium]|nr:flagellar basal body rod protein FlgB [Chromatiales bacterium]
MAISFDKALGIHTHTVGLRARRAEILSANLANADTPNYKAQDLDFQKALQHATEGRGGQDFALTRTHQSHFDVRIQMEGDLGYRIPNQPSVDGNTVDTHTEQMAFTRNAVEYQASLEFLSGKFRGLKNAIRGE